MECRFVRARHMCTTKIEFTLPIFHDHRMTSNQFGVRFTILYHMTYNHVTLYGDVTLEVCQRPTQIRSL